MILELFGVLVFRTHPAGLQGARETPPHPAAREAGLDFEEASGAKETEPGAISRLGHSEVRTGVGEA